ncbi:MAG: DEAD/DEAH box helicase [Chloroflexota bacterium]
MSIDHFLNHFKQDSSLSANIVAWEEIPARGSHFESAFSSVNPALVTALEQQKLWPLYTHQAAAIRAVLQGDNVVVATGTASGKSLCYHIPILNSYEADNSSTALMLFPTKALAQDQCAFLEEMITTMKSGLKHRVYDGDTPVSRRSKVRKEAGIILSNPDMLHAGILPFHTRWARFLSRLRYVVLDEIHIYRGVFGSHVANLIRRLRRICAHYGSSPQFICTSATIANPKSHAENLIEGSVIEIGSDADGSPRGMRNFVIYNPPLLNPALGVRQTARSAALSLAHQMVREQLQTVVFTQSRLETELILGDLRSRLSQVVPTSRLQGYRGGYLPSERRKIESGLRDGTIIATVATNALELGVDIGGLSGCILVGYPGTISSTRQQAGRAGRRLGDSIAIFVAQSNPLNQYLARHPEFVLERNPESALVNPDNLSIMANHIACAVYELPLGKNEIAEQSQIAQDLVADMVEHNLLYQSNTGYHWIESEMPTRAVSLRSGSGDTFVIEDVTQPERPQVVGQMDRESVPLLLYEGAIYLHAGTMFQVKNLDWENGRAAVARVNVDYFTEAIMPRKIRILDCEESKKANGFTISHGCVLVTSQTTGYRMVKRSTLETLGFNPVDLPEQEMETAGAWITLNTDMVHAMESAGYAVGPTNYGPDWDGQRAKALERDGGICRHCSLPPMAGRSHDVHHLKPFRSFGYVPELNRNDKEANQLSNLITLCSRCHQRAESTVRMRGALSGLGTLFHNLVPLFLMCDARDLQVMTDPAPAGFDGPSIIVHERIAGGVGLCEQIYQVNRDILDAALELINVCSCQDGCPACVGPSGEIGPATKEATSALINAMLSA